MRYALFVMLIISALTQAEAARRVDSSRLATFRPSAGRYRPRVFEYSRLSYATECAFNTPSSARLIELSFSERRDYRMLFFTGLPSAACSFIDRAFPH